ncbi:TPA: CPBP family intramembrane metalloprotease [Candidatus Bathyarchaeota archaeon]|nr:CPBP family intramembrane metalloprotease [Candidatus Bathyarchaeota archaeon]
MPNIAKQLEISKKELVVATAAPSSPEKEILEAVKDVLRKKRSMMVIRSSISQWTQKELEEYEELIQLGDKIRCLKYDGLTFAVFFLATGKLPILARFNETMATSAFPFMLVSLAEETWMRGLLLKRLKEWRPEGPAPVMWSSLIFVLMHLPASSLMISQEISLLPLLLLSWSILFVWSAGLAAIVLKTGNLFGPIVIHGLDDFVSKVLYPLQI